MRAVAEKRLLEMFEVIATYDRRELLSQLLDEVEEIDTLVVSSLRPMSDAPRDVPIFVVDKLADKGTLIFAYAVEEMWSLFGYPLLVPESQLRGWSPTPILKED